MRHVFVARGTHVVCCAATMDKITAQIRGALRSPVADRTGLTGTYDLNLLFMPEGRPPEPTTRSSLQHLPEHCRT